MNWKYNALLKGGIAIVAVIVIVVSLKKLIGIGSQTLGDIAREYPQPTAAPAQSSHDMEGTVSPSPRPSEISPETSADVPNSGTDAYPIESPVEDTSMATSADHLLLTGLALNGDLMADARITWEEGFYYEPLSERLADYITGISYPKSPENPAVTIEELSYVHVLYWNFEGNPAEGELICNQSIAQDLVEIFWELHQAEYQIGKIRLIDEYGGDDDLSMADNNTSCFNYRVVSGSSSLSKHAYGLAIDINPLYNPYITYNEDHTVNVFPEAGEDYVDRSVAFPYKIDESDLCCRLFKEHGFTWGGDWNSCKDYQHFQKTLQ